MRRSLKISLYASLLIIAIILIGPGILGYYIKQNEIHLIQQYSKKFPNAKLTLKEYHYGWFRSHASISLTTPEPISFTLNSKITVFQGPLYFYKENNHNRVGLGLGGGESQVYLPSLKKPLSFFFNIGFTGSLKGNMNIENYSDSNASLGHVAIHKLKMNLKSTYYDYIDAPKTMTIKICDFKITPPNADIHSEKGITARNLSYLLDFKNQFNTKTRFQIQSLKIKTDPNDQVKLSNIRFHVHQKLDKNKKIDTKFHFDIDHINYHSQSPALNASLSSFLPLGPVALHMEVNGLDHDTALEFDQKFMNDSTGSLSSTNSQGKTDLTTQAFQSGFMKATQNKALLDEVIKMYSKGLQIKIHPLSVATKTDSAAIKLNLNVLPFNAAQGPMAILSHYNASLNVDISKRWATLLYQITLQSLFSKSGQPIPASAGLFKFLVSKNIITQNNGIYGIQITAQKMSAKIGNKDARQVFGMVMQYLSSLQQPTPPPATDSPAEASPTTKSPTADSKTAVSPTTDSPAATSPNRVPSTAGSPSSIEAHKTKPVLKKNETADNLATTPSLNNTNPSAATPALKKSPVNDTKTSSPQG